MSQHVPETCNGSDGLWLPLIEYSVKSGVSLSTIRRKIKSNSIPYRLEKGRYLILFQEEGNSPIPMLAPRFAESTKKASSRVLTDSSIVGEAWPVMENSVRMVSDAFEHALKEKDERIRMLERRSRELEDRVKELQTLVRALEEKYEVRY